MTTYLELVPDHADLRAEEIVVTSDGVTVAIEKVDGRLIIRTQDGEHGEPVLIDVHDVVPMLMRWMVKHERQVAHREEQDADWMAWDTIDYLLSRLFPREED